MDFPPSYSAFGRPRRFVFGAGAAGAGTGGWALIVINPSSRTLAVREDAVDDGRRVEGEAVVLADGDEPRREFGELVAQDRDELGVAVLLDDVDRARGAAIHAAVSGPIGSALRRQ